MNILESLQFGFAQFSALSPWIFLVIGVFVGILGGAMPGLSPSTTVALLVPFSYGLDASSALILLTSIYIASNYGGSITAILINVPGTPSSSATALDGYALAQKGNSKLALNMALWASVIGGLIGSLVLILFSIPLASLAIKFGPADYFALAIVGLSTVASMGKGNSLKAIVAVLLGLSLAAVGTDPVTGKERWTFGFSALYDGFSLIPVLIGLFAVSEVFEEVLKAKSTTPSNPTLSNSSNAVSTKEKNFLSILLSVRETILKSSVFGTIIGIFPGAGATLASFIAYDFASKKRKSTDPEFGQGNINGIAASESANSSSVGGALIPLLALGLPGSATDAVLLGAFMLHDLTPGPLLFKTAPEIPYGIFASLLLANFFVLLIGYWGNKGFSQIIRIPRGLLQTLIVVLAVIGSYSVSTSIWDAVFCLAFGLIGWCLKRAGFPVAPVVLGLVLGDMIEENFHRAILMDGYKAFFVHPISLTLLSLTVISLVWPALKRLPATIKGRPTT